MTNDKTHMSDQNTTLKQFAGLRTFGLCDRKIEQISETQKESDIPMPIPTKVRIIMNNMALEL
jgi:hypothetical protein